MLSPILEKVTKEADLTTGATGKKVDLVTVDIDQQMELAQEFKVRIPSQIAPSPSPNNARRVSDVYTNYV